VTIREREPATNFHIRLFESSHSFMFVLSGPEFRFTFANPTYLRMLGQADVVGRRFVDVLQDTDPKYLDNLERIWRTKETTVRHNTPYTVCKDGVPRTYYVDVVGQPLFDEDGNVEALFFEGFDVTEKVDTEAQLKFVVREIDHRANNILAVVQSIVNLSNGDGSEALRSNILGRVRALARAQRLLSSGRWRAAELRRLLEEELLPYTLGETTRVHFLGPVMILNPAEVQALAMAFHELATNAAKYGAFSMPSGRVTVSWERDDGGSRRIRWQEDGGPPVKAPDRKGLGANVLERSLLGISGRTHLLWRPEGLVCEFDLPSPEASEDQAAQ
jgi:PAS domain S-box-containing protein